MTTQPTTPEQVKIENGDIVCLCGNEPYLDGFYPCLPDGTEVEPVIGGEWTSLYVCTRCNRIIDYPADTVLDAAIGTTDATSAPVVGVRTPEVTEQVRLTAEREHDAWLAAQPAMGWVTGHPGKVTMRREQPRT